MRGRGRGVEQTAPCMSADVEVLSKRIIMIKAELYKLNNSNIIIRKGKMNFDEYIDSLLVEVEEMVNLGYIDEAWRSLKNLCKYLADMNLATRSMIKLLVR
jgi:hypothetical protein